MLRRCYGPILLYFENLEHRGRYIMEFMFLFTN